MSIPLDNLYEYLESVVNEPVCCYLFRPHGSKNILDLSKLRAYALTAEAISSKIVFHDQEPLLQDYLFNPQVYISKVSSVTDQQHDWYLISINIVTSYANLGLVKSELGGRLIYIGGAPIHNSIILVHGDYNTNTANLMSYGYTPVFLWSHALLALDWFRFVPHDLLLTPMQGKTKKFLIYCRDWTGTREYRLKFQELVAKTGLLDSSQTSISKTVDSIHIKDYTPSNPTYNVIDRTIFNQLNDNAYTSGASATYVASDFNNTDISIVLETVFDVDFVHLTEKTLRAIACGHPFIVVAGPGSLTFLRKYGFKTFSPYINEDYDQEPDAITRLAKVIDTMCELDNLPVDQYNKIISKITRIAKFNQKHFFSKKFFNQIVDQYQADMQNAITQIKSQTTGKNFLMYVREGKIQKKLPMGKKAREIRKSKLSVLRKIRRQNGLYRNIKPNAEQ